MKPRSAGYVRRWAFMLPRNFPLAIGIVFAALIATKPIMANEPTSTGQLKELVSYLEIPAYALKQNAKACSRLLADLKAWTAVEIVKPIVVSESLGESPVKNVLGHCDGEDLASWNVIEGRTWSDYNLDALSPKERSQFGIPFHMVGPFRLYKTNLRNNEKGKKEVVLYGEGTKSPYESYTDGPHFHVIDLRRCEVVNSEQVCVPTANKPCAVGLLKHRAKNYIFEVMRFPHESLFSVTVRSWTYSARTKRDFFSTYCNFVAKDIAQPINPQDAAR